MKHIKTERLTSPFTLLNKDMDTELIFHVALGDIAVFSRSATDNDKPNEDAAAVFPIDDTTVVIMVADGVGGQAEGDAASSNVVHEIDNLIKRHTHNGLELREAILTGIEQANQLIINNTCGAATTIAITEINGRLVRTYHAGDSEILITGQRGKIKYQTLAHSPVGYAVESGLLNNEQAIMHAERHIVSNVLGYRDMHVSVGTQVRLDPRDTLLVATDGLFDNLHKTEIVDYIRKGKLINCCNALIDNTYQRMMEDDPEHPSKHDDLTFILFRLSRD